MKLPKGRRVRPSPLPHCFASIRHLRNSKPFHYFNGSPPFSHQSPGDSINKNTRSDLHSSAISPTPPPSMSSSFSSSPSPDPPIGTPYIYYPKPPANFPVSPSTCLDFSLFKRASFPLFLRSCDRGTKEMVSSSSPSLLPPPLSSRPCVLFFRGDQGLAQG